MCTLQLANANDSNHAAVLTDNGHPWTPAFQRV